MTQLSTGVSNVIAIDIPKKESFYQKRQEVLLAKKEQIVQQPAPLQNEPVVYQASPVEANIPEKEQLDPAATELFGVNPVLPVNNQPTNAELISQSFNQQNQVQIEPIISNNMVNDVSNEILIEIFHDMVKLQDDHDKILGKFLSVLPNKETIKEFNQQLSPQTPLAPVSSPLIEDPVTVNQTVTQPTNHFTEMQNQNVSWEVPNNEISPFIPSTENIFDAPNKVV